MKIPSHLVKACIGGNKSACTIAKRISALYAGATVTFADAEKISDHPNRMPFKGILLRVDEPSDKPPHGSEMHRIYVSSHVVDSKLPGLIGQAVNYDPSDMDSHETKHKVGIITKAWRTGKDVNVSGFVWKKDFPEAERDLKKKGLGMSMELGNVYVDDEHADVWKLDDFEFTGATILKKDAAAYNKTSLTAAAKAAAVVGEGDKMPQKVKEKEVAAAKKEKRPSNGSMALLAAAIGGQLQNALQTTVGPLVSEIKASNERTRESIDELKQLHFIQAGADDGDDEEDEEIVLTAAKEDEEEDMAAAGHEDDEEDMAAAGHEDDDSSDDSSDGDDSSMDAMEDLEIDPAEEDPGEVNEDASNKGHKTTVTKPPKQGEHLPGNVAKGRLHSSAKKGKGMKKPFPGLAAAAEQLNTFRSKNNRLARTIQAMQEEHKKTTKELRTQLRTVNAQLERFTELEGRRSRMPVELINLAAKAGVDLREIKASGQKISVEAVDGWFAAARSQGIMIDPKQRIGMKMLLEEQGVLDQGVIDRGYGVN
jgi:hypothetical protein